MLYLLSVYYCYNYYNIFKRKCKALFNYQSTTFITLDFAKTYKRLTLSIKLNEFEKIQAEVEKQGVSMNSFILECIRDRINKG